MIDVDSQLRHFTPPREIAGEFSKFARYALRLYDRCLRWPFQATMPQGRRRFTPGGYQESAADALSVRPCERRRARPQETAEQLRLRGQIKVHAAADGLMASD
jgi:hypothetical protein